MSALRAVHRAPTWGPMARILLPMLLFALLLAPLRMFGVGEAAASPHHGHHAASGMHHGHAPAAPDDAPAPPKADCMTACAAIAPPVGSDASAYAPAALRHYSAIAASASGVAPEAEPPPPRSSTL